MIGRSYIARVPALNPRIAKMLGWRGPMSEDLPPRESFRALTPRVVNIANPVIREGRSEGWVVPNLANPLLGPDGHYRQIQTRK